MADRVRARLSAAEGRRFGTTVGLALVAVGGLALSRGHPASGAVAASLGGLLTVIGLVSPAALGPVYRVWMWLALAISRVTTPILLGFVYVVAFIPLAVVMRLTGRRVLSHGSPTAKSVWVTRDVASGGRGDLTRQF